MIQLVKSTENHDISVKNPDSRELRDAIFKLEEQLLRLPQAEIEYIHRFTPGLYTREMVVPAGVIMTGAIHKTQHISIFLEGRMVVPCEGSSKEIVAPIVEIANPGVKRVGVALEDVRWLTVHPTDETDIEVLEDMLWTNEPAEISGIIEEHSARTLK